MSGATDSEAWRADAKTLESSENSPFKDWLVRTPGKLDGIMIKPFSGPWGNASTVRQLWVVKDRRPMAASLMTVGPSLEHTVSSAEPGFTGPSKQVALASSKRTKFRTTPWHIYPLDHLDAEARAQQDKLIKAAWEAWKKEQAGGGRRTRKKRSRRSKTKRKRSRGGGRRCARRKTGGRKRRARSRRRH